MNNNALVLIDYINEIVDANGKLSGKGYPNYIERNATAKFVGKLLEKCRSNGTLVVHVKVGFDKNYIDHPKDSPLFGAAKKFNALNSEEWGCEFISYAKPEGNEIVIDKSRVSAFYNTNLESVLRANKIDSLFIAGCSTDLAVQAAARDAHDRDYRVTVVSDACSAASEEDHITSINSLKKIAEISSTENLF